MLWCLKALPCPITATGASTSAPPCGTDCHYISGLCCVCNQLCRSHRLSPQEEVMFMKWSVLYQSINKNVVITSHFVCAFPSCRRSKEQSIPIHLGLAVSLAFLNLLFFFTGVLANAGGEAVCTWVGAGLHYALLSSFAWMGIQVFHTFWLVHRVFSPSPKPYVWMLVGFGECLREYFTKRLFLIPLIIFAFKICFPVVPAVPVIILASVGGIYGTREVVPSDDLSNPFLMWAWIFNYACCGEK